MNNSGKSILVTGATGRQGGAVIQHLLKNNLIVKALSRTPDSIAAQLLVSKGVAVVKGDMSDPQSLLNAMKGCDGVSVSRITLNMGLKMKFNMVKTWLMQRKKSNISHFIYNSVCNANSKQEYPI